MSKSLKNYPDPLKVIDSYGADALRLYLINSAVVKGESLRFAESGVRDIVRSVLLPYWNVYSFFTTYANIDKFTPSADLAASPVNLDRWIISRFQTLLNGIEKEMAEYRLYTVVPVLLEFIEELTNWYVRRSRRRFWSDDAQDKQHGYDTLLYVLLGFTKALAPFLPFITEEIYQNLKSLDSAEQESVHHCDYPIANSKNVSEELEADFTLIQSAVSLGRTLRARLNIRTRQPLQSITVVTKNKDDAAVLKRHEKHILAELNVKEVLFDSNEQDLVAIEIKPNFPVLGPIFGKQMGALSKELRSLSADAIASLEAGKKVTVLDHDLDLSQLQVVRKAKSKDLEIETAGGVTVFFDLKISESLRQEGLARELVNRIQRLRKEADFQIADRIDVRFEANELLDRAFATFKDYIQSEVLALSFEQLNGDSGDGWHADTVDIEGESVKLCLRVAQ